MPFPEQGYMRADSVPEGQGRLRSIELLKTSFGRALYSQRRAIECRFGTLRAAVEWRHYLLGSADSGRVRDWVQAKIITAGARWVLLREPRKLAYA
jgi:hypothetical protein